MTFGQAIRNALSVYDHIFDGRAPRSAYWWLMVPILLIYVVMMVFMATIVPFTQPDGSLGGAAVVPIIFGAIVYLAAMVYGLVMMIPMMVITGQRLHDTNRSAWWILISLVPFIGGIILIVFLTLRGTRGDNRFGPDPLAERGEGLTASSIPNVPR